jgi:cyclic-di-GMP phosphodiesterase TipF (flagellum assembly factor)
MDGLSELGCGFSMDHIKRGAIDAGFLRRRHIGFIKMNAHWLMSEASDRGGIKRMRTLKSALDKAGVSVIVEKIETERDLRELLDYDIDFAQGYYFGKPDYYAVSKPA